MGVVVKFRATEEEKAGWEACAAAEGLTLSEWMRSSLSWVAATEKAEEEEAVARLNEVLGPLPGRPFAGMNEKPLPEGELKPVFCGRCMDCLCAGQPIPERCEGCGREECGR